MLMMKSKTKVINVGYGKGKAELISAQIKTKYEEIIEEALESLEKIIISSQRVTLVGDFNCS